MARNRRLEDLHKLRSLITDQGIAKVAFNNAYDKLRQLDADFERQRKVCNKKKLEFETIHAAMVRKAEELRMVPDKQSKIPAQRGKGD